MEGLHILQVDNSIIEAIQVDDHGGQKVIYERPWDGTDKVSAHRIAWHWRLQEKINEALQ